jgi:phenylacetate-CoA ligase
MTNLLHLYHQLPYPLRVLAATVRGHYLSRWRYTAQSEQLVEEILARDSWSAAQWHAWQTERQAFVLHRAATQVPYYRQQWAARRRRGDKAAWDVLNNWPVLSKEQLRAEPRAFVADDCDPRQMYYEHTSGTTGKPLHIWISKETVQTWFAMFEARSRRWYGVSRHDRWAILGGQLVTPVERQRPPFWVWNAALHQLYLSAYHLSAEHIPAYLEAMRRHRVTYLLGYPSGLYRLAQVALEQELDAPRLTVAIGNAEPLFEHQRRIISHVFQCPVRETYGMAEIATAAGECEAGRLHHWPDVGVMEVLADEEDTAVPAGEAGRFVATGLLNADMPLIRYEIGDRGTVAPEGGCPCGRQMPIWQAVEGRIDDVVVTADGRHIGRLDPVFKADLPVREAQLIQEDLYTIRVKFIPTTAYTAQDGELLAQRIRERVGPMQVVLEQVDDIPRTANGKFRAVVSHVTNKDLHVN